MAIQLDRLVSLSWLPNIRIGVLPLGIQVSVGPYHTFVIYDGGALPEQYNGRLFGVHPLGSHVVMSDVLPDRSSHRAGART